MTTLSPDGDCQHGSELGKNGEEFEDMVQTLPQQKNWDGRMLCQYQGSWLAVRFLRGVWRCQKHFKARETDVILASIPKSGTTWLKALIFSVVNRSTREGSPLLRCSPHELVPFLELDTYKHHENPDLEGIPSPRIFATHVPYGVLPDSIRESGCKIIYVCRNPLDQFVSQWHFLLKNRMQPEEEPLPLEEAFEMYCNGIHSFGPFWDHILDYWKAAGNDQPAGGRPKVLFLKYEELKEDTVSGLKKIAEFIGIPFSREEEEQGKIHEICSLCSFEKMKSLDVNKVGRRSEIIANSSYYRKGEIGDWKNLLTSSMAERVQKLLEERLSGSGLTYDKYIKL